jgi:hypothetical protein
MDWFSDRFSNPSFSLAAPGSASASVENQITNLVIRLQTTAVQALQGSNLVGQLSSQTAPNQSSAFVYIPWQVLIASKPEGSLYANPVPEMERVVVVNDVPLMEPNSRAGANMGLTFYGRMGATYQLQSLADVGGQEALQPLLSYVQTNIQQAVSVDTTQPQGFYRLVQQ